MDFPQGSSMPIRVSVKALAFAVLRRPYLENFIRRAPRRDVPGRRRHDPPQGGERAKGTVKGKSAAVNNKWIRERGMTP